MGFGIALVIGIVVGLLCGDIKFLEPYMIGWALVYVLIAVGRWLG